MSANAALKEQTYTVDAADPVTTAGLALIRLHKTGELAKAFGRPEVARQKVAEKLKALGHEYDIDALCLEALERYVEEHGEVPNATKVIASAQILDRLPDPQFDSGHRVVFAINEDGTDFIGASEMGLAISPSGTTTTSRSGKVDERFGAITKKTLWIMIDFPEKSELDAIEVEQGQALAAVAEAIADPATAAENFDAIVAQVQELGEITDMSPADVVATIETIANAIEAHTIATEVQTLVETGAASPDSPVVEAMTAKVETLSQQVSEQISSLDSALPPVIAETIQAVMETAQPPQAAVVEASAEAGIATSAPVQTQAGVDTPTIAVADVAAATPQISVTDVAADVPQASTTEVAAATTTDNGVSNAEPVAQQHEQAASQTAQTIAADQPAIADPQTVASADVSTATQTQQTVSAETPVAIQTQQQTTPVQQTPSIAEVVAQTPVSLKNDTTVITPQAFEKIQPAAIAAQVTAIAAQLPAALNTAQAQTALKQVATAIKNDHHVPAVLQNKVEAVIRKMPEGPAKRELERVAETVKATQQARKEERKQNPNPTPVHTPIIIRQAFANPVPATPPTPTQTRVVPSPRNDNIVATPTKTPNPDNSGHTPVPVTPANPQPAPTGGPAPVAPTPTQPTPAEGRGPEQRIPTHNDNQRDGVPTQPEGFKPSTNPDRIVPATPGLKETVVPIRNDVVIPTNDAPRVPVDTNPAEVATFEKPCLTTCTKGGNCGACFAGAVSAETRAEQQHEMASVMQNAFRPS